MKLKFILQIGWMIENNLKKNPAVGEYGYFVEEHNPKV